MYEAEVHLRVEVLTGWQNLLTEGTRYLYVSIPALFQKLFNELRVSNGGATPHLVLHLRRATFRLAEVGGSHQTLGSGRGSMAASSTRIGHTTTRSCRDLHSKVILRHRLLAGSITRKDCSGVY